MTHFGVPFDSNYVQKIGDTCRLSGCRKDIENSKKTNKGDWIIGLGGVGFHELKMIYAMRVEKTPPPESKYFKWYGNRAIRIPNNMKYAVIGTLKNRKYRTKGRRIYSPDIYSKFDKFMRNETNNP